MSPSIDPDILLYPPRDRIERPETAPMVEWSDLDELKELSRSAKSQLSALAGLVAKLDLKIQDIEERQRQAIFASRQQIQLEHTPSEEASTSSKPMAHVQAWLKQTEQLQPAQVIAPPPVRPISDAPPATDTLSYGTVDVAAHPYYYQDEEETYLDRFFPDRADLPCRLLLSIMEHIHLKIEKQLSPSAKEYPSHWHAHLKAAIQALVDFYSVPLPKCETRGFQLVANILDVRSDDEVRPLHPLTLYDMITSTDANFVRPICSTTNAILQELKRVGEVLPPVFRAIIEGLGNSGRLYIDDRLWDIELVPLAQRVSQLMKGCEGNAYEVCSELYPHETGQYVRDRLHGSTSLKALNDVRQRRRRFRQLTS